MIYIDEFRDGIFALRTRRFGSVAEIMIKKMFNLQSSNVLEYDLFDKKTNERVEAKFSTVMKENDIVISESNVIEQCLKANIINRAMKFSDVSKSQFDCNIQQIKYIASDIH